MPELPEVETTLRGILPHVRGHRIDAVHVREPRLRYPVPPDLPSRLGGHRVDAIRRRGKYLLFAIGEGNLLIHLGMSGSLGLIPANRIPGKHDHFDLVLSSGMALRYTDPRRFGMALWVEGDPLGHRLLQHLGPEPLGETLAVDSLYDVSRGRTAPVKSFIMDSRVVVGVGNIYANEALFLAGIHPLRRAGRISRERYRRLTAAIREVLLGAIEQGGTSLRDFVGGDGRPGYFRQSLQVYGRGGESCGRCEGTLREIRVGQRSTVYCPRCQR